MEIINSILTWMMKKRFHEVELFMKYPLEVQDELLTNLIDKAKNTTYGCKYNFAEIKNAEQYRANIPIVVYEELFPYIEKVMKGQQNVLWPSEIKWFAKSSGTTNARSKFIPVSPEALDDCHFKGGKDMLSIYFHNHPETKLFTGKGLTIGGSHQINQLDKNANSHYGDVSAVIMKNLPLWAQFVRTPKLEIALMDKWEDKIDRMAEITMKENVTSISGVPTWTLILLQRILELTGKDNIMEVWPNLELFAHGAVAFKPYETVFKNFIPGTQMNYLETYNASEGFFGIQDLSDSQELLLMLDYGIYYEFIPMDRIGNEANIAIDLSQVKIGENYAMVISTNAGLWRYKIGDTIKFTSLSPYRIKISGRTKHFINAFGEELIIENAESAITEACQVTGAIIDNFTAGPRYLNGYDKGSHEWIIEFNKMPNDLDFFTQCLDENLRKINSDYDAKRYKNIALELPVVLSVPKGTFYNWMKKRGKLGGQNKVPRLANNREYLEDIHTMLSVMS